MAREAMSMEPESEAMPRDEASELRVDVIPGRRFALSGVKNTVRVVLRVRTPADDGAEARPPVSVACVLDRSGSMGGRKLDYAKRACKKLVKHLNVGDTLHFITYDDKVNTVFENADLSDTGKEAMKEKIDRVVEGATTNLYGGLQRAATLLGSRADLTGKTPTQPLDDKQVRRIFLFSDGLVNAGEIKDSHEIRRRVAAWAAEGITTTTFGIGSDFDEPLMRGIAESGKGRYTFLGSPRDIPRLVSKSIHDLLKLYGSEASVDIRGCSHSTVAKVYRGNEEDDESCDATASGLLQLGDLHNDNERMVLLELESAPPGDITDGSQFKAAEWYLNFTRNGTLAQFSGSVDLVAVKERASLGTEAASVQAMFAIRSSSDMDEEIAKYLSQRDKIRARDVKSRQLSLLKETLEIARNSPDVDPVDVEALEQVLRRAESVSHQLEEDGDMELVRRQCVQEMELTRAMSIAGFSEGCNSSEGSASEGSAEDIGARHLAGRLHDFDGMMSDDDASVCTRSTAGSPPNSPRPPASHAKTETETATEAQNQPQNQPQNSQQSDSCSLM